MMTILYPGNVILTPKGNFAFIVPIIYLNTEEKDFDGKRILGAVF